MKINISRTLIWLCIFILSIDFRAKSQQDKLKPLTTGDYFSDISLNDIFNRSLSNEKTFELKKKFLILD
ncbi:MAG TPA: hypothetical protein VHD35_17290, partial [Chitinophagaceae bacterium]|nr:hypothetical protein [Chitinophagaceae bacterium]